MNDEFRIGPWLVQPSLNLVSGSTATVRLEPKVMQVLVCLAQRPGKMFPKEELMRTVWPDTFVTDDVLKRCVSELRRVFEDDAREPRIIETVPRLGYRLLPPVHEVDIAVVVHRKQPAEPDQSITASDRQQLPPGERPTVMPNRKWLAGTFVSLLVLVASVTVAYVRGKRSTVAAPPSFHRLTFERGIIYSARFAPDNHVVYDASWDNRPVRIFTTRADLPQTMSLDFPSAHLLGISATGELALTLNGYLESYPVFLRGTLARADGRRLAPPAPRGRTLGRLGPKR